MWRLKVEFLIIYSGSKTDWKFYCDIPKDREKVFTQDNINEIFLEGFLIEKSKKVLNPD